MKKFIWLDLMFEAFRLLPAAVSVSFLLSRGVPIYLIGELKMVQAVLGFALEVPTGILSDTLGHKKTLLASIIFGGLSFLLYAFGSNFVYYFIAEAMLAICLCLWSGAYEAYALNSVAGINERRFFSLNHSWNTGGGLVAGFLGAQLYAIYNINPFAYAAILFFLLFFFLLSFKADTTSSKKMPNLRAGFVEQIKLVQKLLKSSSEIRHLLFLNVFSGAALLPWIHYWQVFFEKWGGAMGHSFSVTRLGFVYLCFQLVLFATGFLNSKLNLTENKNSHKVFLTAACILGIGVMQTSNFVLSLILFCGLEICHCLASVGFKSSLSNLTPTHLKATLFSTLSLFSRLGGCLGLGLVTFNLRYFKGPNVFANTIRVEQLLCLIFLFGYFVFRATRAKHSFSLTTEATKPVVCSDPSL